MLQRLSLATALILYCVSFSYAQRGAGVAITNISAEPKNVYALIIGISNYKEVPKLEYTVNDAELIYNILNQKFPKSSGNIVKLIDAEANEVRIQRELKNIFSQASDGDLVVVYFAGHGDVANVIGEESGFFLTANASKSREYEFGGAISFELVMKYINGIASKNAKVWLITDACRSGKIINEAGAKGTLTALNSSFLNTTKFISCQGHELSYEYKEIKHGVFTYYLARGFSGEADIEEEDGNITVEELRRYLQKNVRKFTENLQSPKVSGSDDFEIIAISNQKLLAFLTSEYKPGTSNAFAGIGRNTGEGAEKSLVLKSFEEALYAGKLHTVENSAYSIWEKSKSSKETSQKEVTIMKDLLIEALVERGQNSINLFLSSHPSVGRKSDFETSVKDFKLAAKILGKDDDFYETLINRSQFFEALVIIQNKDYNNLNKAEELLVKLKEIEPNAAYTHQGLALLYMLKSQKNEAEKELLAASKKISTWEKPKNTNAYIKILSGRLEEASDIIKEVEMLTSGSTETSILKSKLFTAKLELKSAEAELKKLKELKVEDVDNEILLLLAQVEQLRGRIKKADDVYMSVLENDKNNIEALKGLAIMYRNDKDTAKAIQYFELAIKVAPNDNESLLALKQLKGEKTEISVEAVNYYDWDDVKRTATLFARRGRVDDAFKIYNKAIETLNWNPALHYEMAMLSLNLNKKADAEKYLKNAILQSPYHFESIKALAELYISQKKVNEADLLIKTHDAKFDGSAKWQTFKFDIYRKINIKADVWAMLEKAKKSDSLDTEIYRSLYKYYIENDDYKKAKEEFGKVINLGGRHLDSLEFVFKVAEQAEMQLAKGNFDKAVGGLNIILGFNPYDLSAVFNLGKSNYMMKNYRGAMKYINDFEKYLLYLTVEEQIRFYELKGKVLLEIGYFKEAEESFKLANTRAVKPQYLGMAMAQFELGKVNEWRENLLRDRRSNPHLTLRSAFLKEYNEDALKRLEKMEKKVK